MTCLIPCVTTAEGLPALGAKMTQESVQAIYHLRYYFTLSPK